MLRMIPIALLALLALGGNISRANDGECCETCGCQLKCEVMCEWGTRDVLRYKPDYTECPPPCSVCCLDRWIVGCPKPIKIMNLKPSYEKKKYLVRQYVVRTCPHCDCQNATTKPTPEKSASRKP